MAVVPVDWGVLQMHHPSYTQIGQKVKGIPKGWETCCIQMSHALNGAGAPIKNTGGVVGLQDRGRNYAIRVPTLRAYLDREFGAAENYKALQRFVKIAMITDRTGILAFGDRHIDLWDGSDIHRPSDYILSALWESKSALEKGIYFWEVP
jgi:hypothetical protein